MATLDELKTKLENIKRIIETSNPDPMHRPNRVYEYLQDTIAYLEAEAAQEPLSSGQGWAYYVDSQYTSGSPRTISGNTRTLLTNNKLGADTNETYLPSDTITWWNSTTNRFTPTNLGDAYDVRLGIIANASGSNPYITFDLDVGGSIGIIWANTGVFARGAGVATRFTMSIPVFTLDTFLSNGGGFYITTSSSTTIYGITMLVQRVFKA